MAREFRFLISLSLRSANGIWWINANNYIGTNCCGIYMGAGGTPACPGDKEISSFYQGGSDANVGGTVSIGTTKNKYSSQQ